MEAGSGYDGLRITSYGGDLTNLTIVNSGQILADRVATPRRLLREPATAATRLRFTPATRDGINITNDGLIQGGNGGTAVTSGFGSYGGNGVYVNASNVLTNFSLVNNGTIQGGDGNGSATRRHRRQYLWHPIGNDSNVVVNQQRHDQRRRGH